MTKRIIIILSSVILFIFLVLIIQAALQPKPFRWTPTYSSTDKQPYGGALIFRQLRNFFPGQVVRRFKISDFNAYYFWLNNESTAANTAIDTEDMRQEAFSYQDSSIKFYKDGEITKELHNDTDKAIIIYQDGKAISLDTLGVKDEPVELNDIEEEANIGLKYDSSFYLINLDFDSTYQKPFNIIMISSYFYCNELNSRALLLHVYQGNEVFIAAEEFDENLSQFLGLQTVTDTLDTSNIERKHEEFQITLQDHAPVQLRGYGFFSHFINFPDSASVIAYNESGDVLGLKYSIGKGSVTLFSVPLVFTNYYLLKQNNKVAENLLLSLPNRDTYYGNKITGSSDYPGRESLLSYIHSQEALTWAFYTAILSILTLLLFQIKRRQRSIPVMSKPQNDSLRFVEVITNLYLLNKNNKALLKKKMTYFLEMIRSKYHLNTSEVDEAFLSQLAIKSKVDINIVRTIFKDYDILSRQERIPNPELMHFSKKIQHFKHRK